MLEMVYCCEILGLSRSSSDLTDDSVLRVCLTVGFGDVFLCVSHVLV